MRKQRKQRLQAIENLPPPIINRPISHKKLAKAVKKGSWGSSLLAIALICAGVSLIAGGALLGLQLFVNPNAVVGVNKFLPQWAQLPVVESEDAPQTLIQIQTYLRNQGQTPDEPIVLETDPKTLIAKSLVIPILKQRANCHSDCQEITEIRLYQLAVNNLKTPLQSAENTYQLISQLPIVGPEESFAIAPMVDPDTPNYGSTQLLPLSQLHRFIGTTPPGIWLYLIGERQQATNAIAYGHILHYNPNSSALNLALTWTSPTGQIPKWQQITGGGLPELVVDRTSDLEPQLQVYQVKPAQDAQDQYQLTTISLEEPAIKTPAYRDAIFLARNGLWTPASQWLQSIKKQRRGKISATAQAQIDLVSLYAKYTKKQAESAWASPSQEVLANLIDGRWQKGLQVFQASPENTQEVVTLLVNDSGRLWNRVDAALQVNPNRLEVQTWGALILGAQEGHQSAIAWFKQQPQTNEKNLTYIDKLLKRLDGDYSDNNPLQNRTSRIIGYATAITNPNLDDWLQPEELAQIPAEQWQQVQVVAYHDGKRWQKQPFTDLKLPEKEPAKFLWQQLGLDKDSRIDFIVRLPDGLQQTTTTTVKAVQLQNGALRLLTAKEGAIAPKTTPIALSAEAVKWIEPTPITLKEFIQQESVDATQFLPTIWRELQKSNTNLDKQVPNFEQLQQQLGQFPVQLIDLTGDGNSEIVLTTSRSVINNLTKDNKSAFSDRARNYTVIFSANGAVMYSEFGSATGTIRAIADLQDTAPPALLVEEAERYDMRRWSTLNQRFE